MKQENINRKWYSGMFDTEDWWSAWLGLFLVALGLLFIWNIDAVGWMVKPKIWEWTDLTSGFSWSKLWKTSSKAYGDWHPLFALVVSYLAFLLMTSVGAYFMKWNLKKFVYSFTVIFFLTFAAWILGHEAHFAAVNATVKGKNYFEIYNLSWGLQLGGGFAFILALVIGLFIGNFTTGFAGKLKEAAKPEWFIKAAIVLLGAKLAIMSMKAAGFTYELAAAGAAAAFVAYLLFWPVVYYIGRKYFGLNRNAAAVLSSGISICGVSASIATAGAIRAKPVIPVAVSTLIIIFAMFELIVLPPAYVNIAPNQPIVNGAAMGMTVKTDGADAAAGAILAELHHAQHLKKTGENWDKDFILSAAILTKIWIDIFIGIWAFVLAIIWLRYVENNGDKKKIPKMELWHRLPKFVLAYLVAWFGLTALFYFAKDLAPAIKEGAHLVQGSFRKFLFMLTFLSIGIITDFRKMRGMGKLTLLYAVALFVIIAPIAYLVAWIFHNGMLPLSE